MMGCSSRLFVALLPFVLGGVISGCAPASGPDPTRQPWRDSGAALPAAMTGDAEGLRKSFAAARAQLELPFINGGEDAEAMSENMTAILEATGDRRFLQALMEEKPETRSAVRNFLSEEATAAKFPLTHAALVAAPLVKWPSDEAMERSEREDGATPTPVVGWRPAR